MKTVEMIEKEYKTYKGRTDYLKNAGDLTMFLEIGMDDIKESIQTLYHEIEENKKQKLEARIRNFFFFIFGEEELEFFEEDTKVVQEEIDLCNRFISYFETIQELAVDSSIPELTRLTDFLNDYYNSNFDHLESKRDGLEIARMGISYMSAKYEDTQEPIDTFFQRRVQYLKGEKPVEKTKNI